MGFSENVGILSQRHMLLLLLLNNWRLAYDGHPERSGVRAGGTEEQTDHIHTPQTIMNARAPVVLKFST